MKVVIKLFASLRVGRFKTAEREYTEGTTLKELFNSLGLQLIDVSIVRINGKAVSDDYLLKEADQISLFPPMGGG